VNEREESVKREAVRVFNINVERWPKAVKGRVESENMAMKSLRQLETKFDQLDTYDLSQCSGSLTARTLYQPWTIFTMATMEMEMEQCNKLPQLARTRPFDYGMWKPDPASTSYMDIPTLSIAWFTRRKEIKLFLEARIEQCDSGMWRQDLVAIL
jgi:hypothetical protein